MSRIVLLFSLHYAQFQNHSYQRCDLRFSHTESRFISAETSECSHSTQLKPNRFGIGVDPSVGQCDRTLTMWATNIKTCM